MRSTSALKSKSAPSDEGTDLQAPRSGSRASGQRTRQKILRAAKRVLATRGYARFTLRSVAREAGLTVGNLAYHYRSKRTLVRALIMLLIAEYRAQVEKQLHSAPASPPKAFNSLAAWLMQDSVSTETSRLFREFWTIALHDAFIANAVDSFYAEVQETMATLLRNHFPVLSARSAREIAQLTGMIAEGSNVFYATARKPIAPFRRVSRLACALLLGAAQRVA